jgi:transposase
MSELEAARQRIAELEEQLAETRRQLDVLARIVFGRKSERTPPPPIPGQMDLELGLENAAIEHAPPLPKKQRRKGGSRKGRKTRTARLPEHIPVQEHTILPPEVKADPEGWREIRREETEFLERIPRQLLRIRIVRPVCVRKDQPLAAPVCAPAPAQVVPGGFLGPGFLADMILGKFLHHLPLYRQAQILEWEDGVELSLATMCQNVGAVADVVSPVVRCMEANMWAGGYVQMDLTPMRCLAGEKPGGSFLGQMWVAAEPGGDVIFTWDKSKAALVAERIVPEGFAGTLQCDGSSEIACFLAGGKGRTRQPPPIRRAGCWAHVRRNFFEAAKAGCLIARWLLTIINVLYRIEDVARKGNFSAEQRLALRQKRGKRVIDGFRRRIDATLAKVRPKSPVGRACLYALGQWESLLVYLDDGRIEIDNNGVENAIRPSAVGKKNFLFIGHVGAGQRAATFYSLLGSCLRRDINPRAYLQWLFERLPTATNQTVRELTPAAYAALQSVPVPALAA